MKAPLCWESFMREWGQGDLFPARATVGVESVVVLPVRTPVSGHFTEAGRCLNGANNRGSQRSLPLTSARRESK